MITDEDTLITISAERLLGNYVNSLYGDNSTDDFSIVSVSSDSGTATINSEGDVEFTPAANLNGTVSFELTVTDDVDNYTELVEVEVIPVNDPLITNNDTAIADEDVPLTISASSLFANDNNSDRSLRQEVELEKLPNIAVLEVVTEVSIIANDTFVVE